MRPSGAAARRGVFAATLALAGGLSGGLSGGAASAADERGPLDAEASDPGRLGWMQGSPPPEDRTIRGYDRDFFAFPKLRWTVCNMRALVPTVGVDRGLGAPWELPRALDPSLDAVTFTPLGGGAPMDWAESLAANYTDGIAVLHEGRIVYERYSGCLDETGEHAAMSVTKSLVGLLGEILIAEGTLDETARVGDLVPELEASAFGEATVRQLLDMTTALDYSEDYADPAADVWRHGAAGSPWPRPAGEAGPRGFYDFLRGVRAAGPHGEGFGYKTVNTDALGWVLARAAGKSVAELLSERVWAPMGAGESGYFQIDGTGTPFAGGGFSARLRDLARVGQLMLDEGMAGVRRVFPAAAVESIRVGGDREAFADAGYATLPGWSYRGMWWVTHDDHGAFAARGVHGQTIWVDPTARMVIVRFASHPSAANAAIDPTSLPAYRAVAEHLMAGAR